MVRFHPIALQPGYQSCKTTHNLWRRPNLKVINMKLTVNDQCKIHSFLEFAKDIIGDASLEDHAADKIAFEDDIGTIENLMIGIDESHSAYERLLVEENPDGFRKTEIDCAIESGMHGIAVDLICHGFGKVEEVVLQFDQSIDYDSLSTEKYEVEDDFFGKKKTCERWEEERKQWDIVCNQFSEDFIWIVWSWEMEIIELAEICKRKAITGENYDTEISEIMYLSARMRWCEEGDAKDYVIPNEPTASIEFKRLINPLERKK